MDSSTEPHQTERYERYQQVRALREQGVQIKEIAKRVGLGRRTVQSWLTHDEYPETQYHQKHRSRFDAYADYVMQRWEQGCHNIEQLWREIKAASAILIPLKHCVSTSNHSVAG